MQNHLMMLMNMIMNSWPIQSRLQAFFLIFLVFVSSLLVWTTLNAAFRHSNAQLENRFDNTRQVLRYKFSNDGRALNNVIETASRSFSIKQLIAGAKEDKHSLLVALQNIEKRSGASFVAVADPQFNTLVSTNNAELLSQTNVKDITTPDFIELNDGNIYLVAKVAVKFVERQPKANAWLFIGRSINALMNNDVEQLTAFDIFVIDNKEIYVNANKDQALASRLVNRADIKDFSTVEFTDESYLIKGYKLSDEGTSNASIFLSSPSESAYLNFQNLSAQLGFQILFSVAVAIAVSIAIARSISKPMKVIEKGAKSIQEGDYQTEFPVFAMPELNNLATAFDKMQVGINRREREIQTLAYNNMLTELPNRNAYLKQLNIVVEQRVYDQFAVVYLDLDRFKVINDTIGHDSGDLLLREIGNRLSSLDIEQSFVSHTDGDEFAFILPFNNNAALKVMLEQIAAVFDIPFRIDGIYLDVNVSVGVACYPEHSREPQKLLQYADIALYQSKGSHKVVEHYQESFNHYSVQRLNLMSELRLAIEEDHLSLFYQPKLCIDTNEVVSVESLVRWIHPEHGFIGPDEFIPLAEQTGAIRDLTTWVVTQAIRQQKAWCKKGINLQMSVNISAHDLVDFQLVAKVASLLSEHNVSADRLKIEVTESAIMADASQAIDTLNMLRNLGVALSIDDFGTGYSSMSQLRDMPVDELKIDKSFVMDLPENTGNKKIVASTVGLAHSLGLSVVAEGVETLEGLTFLKTLGVELAQGYYIAKPLQADAFEQWLKERT